MCGINLQKIWRDDKKCKGEAGGMKREKASCTSSWGKHEKWGKGSEKGGGDERVKEKIEIGEGGF